MIKSVRFTYLEPFSKFNSFISLNIDNISHNQKIKVYIVGGLCHIATHWLVAEANIFSAFVTMNKLLLSPSLQTKFLT
jgi:hypothetical protein